jgi:2-polyprenyl-3-methyl-5-hydroxy-6-metoxy-1,4-benzoquinol methylase
MCAIQDGVPQCARYIRELLEGVSIPRAASLYAKALEVGCGCSMYAPLVQQLGYRYFGIEPSEWAAHWTRSTFNVQVDQSTVEEAVLIPNSYDLVIAAHVLEHVSSVIGVLEKLHLAMRPSATLIIVVPDDQDRTNPDHWWFFTEVSLQRTLAETGFTEIQMKSIKRVEYEDFIYCSATKRLPWKQSGV